MNKDNQLRRHSSEERPGAQGSGSAPIYPSATPSPGRVRRYSAECVDLECVTFDVDATNATAAARELRREALMQQLLGHQLLGLSTYRRPSDLFKTNTHDKSAL